MFQKVSLDLSKNKRQSSHANIITTANFENLLLKLVMRDRKKIKNAVNNLLAFSFLFLQFWGWWVSQESENSAFGHKDDHSVFKTKVQHKQRECVYSHKCCYLLIGEVRGPAPPTVLAMIRSAICRSARRPEGLWPLVSWSWIRPSSSSLNTFTQTIGEINLHYPSNPHIASVQHY